MNHQFALHLPAANAEPAELRRAKARAHAAFMAYEAAMRDGDRELAQAARERFLDASALLSGLRKGDR